MEALEILEEIRTWEADTRKQLVSILHKELAEEDGPEGGRQRVQSYAEFCERPETNWVVEQRISERSCGLIYGPSENGKSFVVQDLLLRIAGGAPDWAGAEILQHGPVLYVPLEGVGGVRKRVDAWVLAHPEFAGAVDNFYLFADDGLNLVKAETVLALSGDIHERGVEPTVIVVDTLATACLGYDENQTKDMQMAMSSMAYLARQHNAVVCTVHHTGWGATHPRGATAIHAAPDWEYYVANRKVECTKLRDGNKEDVKPWKFALKESGESAYVALSTAAERVRSVELVPAPLPVQILDWLGTVDDGKVQDFLDNVLHNKSPQARANVRNELNRLIDSGSVERCGYGNTHFRVVSEGVA